MKIIYLLPFLLFLLSGCAEEDGNNHGYGYRVDAYDPQYGVSVQYGEGAYQYPIEKVTQAFLEVQECMAMYSSGVMVVIQDADSVGSWYGLTYLDSALVIVSDDYLCYNNVHILKHEFVHVILAENSFNEAMNINHDTDIFRYCS